MKHFGIIERYRSHLPIKSDLVPVTLYEGNTPLFPLKNLQRYLKTSCELYAKFEGMNPTGSFKDRGMTLAVSQAVYEGSQAILCASTGNTAASAAAYAARAKVRCFVLIPEGQIALGKLSQAMIHGAAVLQIAGNFDEGMQIVKTLKELLDIHLVNSVNPYRLEGQKTAAFEVVEALNDAPDYHVLPVGNAGNISAYFMGYCDYFSKGMSQHIPKMVGYQAEGAAPFIQGKMIDSPETIATAIRIGAPQSFDKAKQAVEKSRGWFAAVSDEAILNAQQLLASQEGIFCEPASAASVAGLIQDLQQDRFYSGRIVCTLTGHGLKDPENAILASGGQINSVPAELTAIKAYIENQLI